ncbi:zinc ribbon domain-containing protein [bacterium]|nr:zinc ribbon domain-containing protein [bacterium]
MSMTAFTRNYTDHSSQTGFQFEFFCDKCGNGWRSEFVASKSGLVAGLLGVAGSFFGGNVATAAAAGNTAKDFLRGKAWDSAYAAAIDEGKAHFKQCTRCGKWVCPEVCWNDERELCGECAPDLAEEAAAAQAQAMRQQVFDKALKVDQTEGVDLSKKQTVSSGACPHCGARAQGKFCPECGKPLAAAKAECGKCGAKLAPKAKFCAECGTPA